MLKMTLVAAGLLAATASASAMEPPSNDVREQLDPTRVATSARGRALAPRGEAGAIETLKGAKGVQLLLDGDMPAPDIVHLAEAWIGAARSLLPGRF